MATHASIANRTALPTTGTQLFLLNKRTGVMFEVPCVTSIGDISVENEMEDITCIRDTARRYQAQMASASQTSFGMYFNAYNPESVRLFNARRDKDEFVVALAFPEFDADGLLVSADDASKPTVDITTDPSNPMFELTDERIYLVFDAAVVSFPISGEVAANFSSTLTLQINGDPELAPESALPDLTLPTEP